MTQLYVKSNVLDAHWKYIFLCHYWVGNVERVGTYQAKNFF